MQGLHSSEFAGYGARCGFECLCVRAFTLNNTTELIVPNTIMCLLAKTLHEICISGYAERGTNTARRISMRCLTYFFTQRVFILFITCDCEGK